MRAGDGLEALDPAELALEGAVVLEDVAVNDLDGAERPKSVPGQPDFAVAAPADLAEQLMIGDLGRLGGWASVSKIRGVRAGREGGVRDLSAPRLGRKARIPAVQSDLTLNRACRCGKLPCLRGTGQHNLHHAIRAAGWACAGRCLNIARKNWHQPGRSFVG